MRDPSWLVLLVFVGAAIGVICDPVQSTSIADAGQPVVDAGPAPRWSVANCGRQALRCHTIDGGTFIVPAPPRESRLGCTAGNVCLTSAPIESTFAGCDGSSWTLTREVREAK